MLLYFCNLFYSFVIIPFISELLKVYSVLNNILLSVLFFSIIIYSGLFCCSNVVMVNVCICIGFIFKWKRRSWTARTFWLPWTSGENWDFSPLLKKKHADNRFLMLVFDSMNCYTSLINFFGLFRDHQVQKGLKETMVLQVYLEFRFVFNCLN